MQVIRTKSISLEAVLSRAGITQASSKADKSASVPEPVPEPSIKLKVPMTFVDTPGQEIFYRMRNYGVSVADIAMLVISCEEGVSRKRN
jgi:translation initiation factor IF-2